MNVYGDLHTLLKALGCAAFNCVYKCISFRSEFSLEVSEIFGVGLASLFLR